MKPFPAQPFDPITQTKCASAFDWYVGGKLYHFSSIASLEAFVINAKTDPRPLPSPDKFITPGKPVEEG
jgi:YHS domain-containing protein